MGAAGLEAGVAREGGDVAAGDEVGEVCRDVGAEGGNDAGALDGSDERGGVEIEERLNVNQGQEREERDGLAIGD